MKKTAMAAALIMALGPGEALGSSYDNLNAGIQLHNLKQWGASIAAFDNALAPGDLLANQKCVAHMDRGLAYLALNQYSAALTDYTACLAIQPKNEMALFERANIHFLMGDMAEAAADLDTLIALRPMLASAYATRAVINARLGKATQSTEDSKTALSLLPNGYPSSIGTGVIAWQAGKTSTAEDNFRYAARQGPTKIFAWLWLALTEVRTGKPIPREDLPEFDKEIWPAPIVSFFLGDISQDAVFAAAGGGSDPVSQSRICEANFYVGEWLSQHHDRAAAQPMIQKAADRCPVNFLEWRAAQTELAGLAR